MLSHHGYLPGGISLTSMFPDLQLGIFISMNGGIQRHSYFIQNKIHAYITDMALQVEPWLTDDIMCTFDRPSASSEVPPDPETHLACRPLADYTGMYHQPAYGNITVWIESDTKHLQMSYGQSVFTLKPLQRFHHFTVLPQDDMFMEFVFDIYFEEELETKNDSHNVMNIISTVHFPDWFLGQNVFLRWGPNSLDCPEFCLREQLNPRRQCRVNTLFNSAHSLSNVLQYCPTLLLCEMFYISSCYFSRIIYVYSYFLSSQFHSSSTE